MESIFGWERETELNYKRISAIETEGIVVLNRLQDQEIQAHTLARRKRNKKEKKECGSISLYAYK